MRSAPRARAVVDLPTDALLGRADEMARRWAIVLILDRPLERIGDLPLEDLAREAPALCAQAIRALESDAELDRLLEGGAPTGREDRPPAPRLAAIAGARDARGAVEAVEALRGVLWETLLDELGHSLSGRTPPLFERSSARQLADLSDRLAYVCARALAATIVAPPAPESDVPIRAAAVVVAAPGGMARDPGEQTAAAGRGAVIVDERAADPLSARVAVPSAAPPVGQPADRPPSWDGAPPAPSRASRLEDRPLSWDESPLVPLPASRPEIEIRDERGDGGAAAWIGSVGRQLERFDQDGLPFAVLLVEVLDIERLYRGGRPGDASRVADAVEESIAAELRRLSGSLTRESAGRYWLLAPHTDRAGAPSLAEQLARAVASAAIRTTGASLEVAIGTAVCPDHGREAAALAAHADVELYAARSAARSSSARPAAPVDGPA